MHKSYKTRLGHPADFRVEYRFYSENEGGRKTIPFQGYRSDFWYEHPDHKKNSLFVIWPEFEDAKRKIILAKNSSVRQKGTARMWIIFGENRDYHQNKIFIGMKGYFMEGPRRVAECEVIEILGLESNPRRLKKRIDKLL